MITWDPIAPGELLLSGINWLPRLATGDTITSSVWSASTPTGLTVAANIPNWVASTTLVWISTPTLGTLYSLTNTITTAFGNIEVETVQFPCALK